jgi:hypothetical protein
VASKPAETSTKPGWNAYPVIRAQLVGVQTKEEPKKIAKVIFCWKMSFSDMGRKQIYSC